MFRRRVKVYIFDQEVTKSCIGVPKQFQRPPVEGYCILAAQETLESCWVQTFEQVWFWMHSRALGRIPETRIAKVSRTRRLLLLALEQ